MKEIILVSSCLLGNNCKYNGGNNYSEDVVKLKEKYNVIPICPETFGGLKVPRLPSEIKGDRVVSKIGKDVTKEFLDGAQKALYIAKSYNCKKAILKDKSPSCGVNYIYDGSFENKIIDGKGITAKLFIENGIAIYSEKELKKLL